MDGELYQEVQRLPQDMVRILSALCIFIVISCVAIFLIGALVTPSPEQTARTVIMACMAVIVLCMLRFSFKMKTTVTYGSLTISVGIRKRVVPIINIRSITAEDYQKRKWFSYIKYKGDWCYIMSGSERGLWIELTVGRPFMLSSADTERLEAAIKEAIGSFGGQRH